MRVNEIRVNYYSWIIPLSSFGNWIVETYTGLEAWILVTGDVALFSRTDSAPLAWQTHDIDLVACLNWPVKFQKSNIIRRIPSTILLVYDEFLHTEGLLNERWST